MNRVNVAPCPSGDVTTVSPGRFKSDRSHHAGIPRVCWCDPA